jgi:hypothetical protein
MKPLKLPGEKDPTQAISTCPYCNSSVNQNEQQCPNCKQVITPKQGQPHPRKVPQKGERYEDYGPSFDFTVKGRPIAASKQAGGRKRKKDKDLAEHSEDTVKDEFSEKFDQCLDPRGKNRRENRKEYREDRREYRENADIKKEEVMRSCEDLAIDG